MGLLMGRTAKLDQIEGGVETFAEAWVLGATRADLAKHFSISKETVTSYIQRDDVKAAAGKLIRDRILKIKRSADAKIAQALEELDAKDDIDSILKIRKEFAGEIIPDGEMSDQELLEAAFDALDSNPELAEQLTEAQVSHESV